MAEGRTPPPLCIVSAKMTLEGNGGRADVVITRQGQNLILEPPFYVRIMDVVVVRKRAM